MTSSYRNKISQFIFNKVFSLFRGVNSVHCNDRNFGIFFYFFLIIIIQDLIGFLEISFQIFTLSIIIFSICIIDDITFNFLKEVTKYIKILSWILIMVSSNSFIFISIPIINIQSIVIRVPNSRAMILLQDFMRRL